MPPASPKYATTAIERRRFPDPGGSAANGTGRESLLPSAPQDTGELLESSGRGHREVVLPCGVRLTGVEIDLPSNALFDGQCEQHDGTSRLDMDGHEGATPAETAVIVDQGYRLTEREIEILTLLASGSCDKEIGISLCISRSTVQSHVGAITRKARVNNRVQLGVVASQLGLVSRRAERTGSVQAGHENRPAGT